MDYMERLFKTLENLGLTKGRLTMSEPNDEPKAVAGINPQAEGFIERVTPKPIDGSKLFLHECGNCGGVHFRHAGYVEVLTPFIRPGDEKRMLMLSEPVKICVNCKHSFVWVSEQVYDLTDKIDVAAWERTECEAYRATGPGGQC